MPDWRNASPFLWATLAVLCWGVAPFFEKAGLGKIAPLPATALRSWMIGICLLGTVTFSGAWKDIAGVDLRSLGLLLAGGFLAGLVGQVVFFMALRGGHPSQIVPFTAAYPLITMLLSVVVLREAVTPGRVVGAICVAVGLVLLRLGG